MIRVDVEFNDKLEDKLLKFMKANNISSRSEAVRTIMESYFDCDRLINQKILSLVTELHEKIVFDRK